MAQIVRDRALSPQEIQAVGSFLSDSVAEFAGLASSDVALKVHCVLSVSLHLDASMY